MKYLFIIVLLSSAFAQARDCRLSVSDRGESPLSLMKSGIEGTEVPDGVCKQVKRDFLKSNNLNCEDVLDFMTTHSPLTSRRYSCSQTTKSISYEKINGRDVFTTSAACFICKKGNDDLLAYSK